MVKKKQTPLHLSLHSLLGSLSYWGTMTRAMLVAFIAASIMLIRVLEAQSSTDTSFSQTFLAEGQMLVYVIGSFLILDIGYVIISRAYEFTKRYDIAALLAAEMLLFISFFIPYLVVVTEQFARISQWVFIAVLFVLSARLLFGILYGKPVKK